MFTLLKTEGRARRGQLTCAHGTAQTPVFMNVGTQGAIKGAVSAQDLREIGCQIELSNTYHLHLRPGDELVKEIGGLHRFMRWDGPILTDSGGFQVFSLSGRRKIQEEGVTFASHIDGRRIFMGPEESIQIQWNLGSDIAMAFDECVENPAPYAYVKQSCERTFRWLERCKTEHARLKQLADGVNPQQMLFGINQGGILPDLRVWHMQQIASLDCDGYAIGGLAVGEPAETMYEIIEAVEPYMPAEKPRYLMGVGTPVNILEGVARGGDPVEPVATGRCDNPSGVFSPRLFPLLWHCGFDGGNGALWCSVCWCGVWANLSIGCAGTICARNHRSAAEGGKSAEGHSVFPPYGSQSAGFGTLRVFGSGSGS